MGKKINTDEINESLIIASVRNRTIVPENKPAEIVPENKPAEVVPENKLAEVMPESKPVEIAPNPAFGSNQPDQPEVETTLVSPEPPKEEIRSKRIIHLGYESRFIRETDLPPARFGKSVYIRKEYHDRISQIISVIGGNEVSLFGYIDNVLAHHFETFQDEITRSFKKKIIFK
jgi:hypothetical protein